MKVSEVRAGLGRQYRAFLPDILGQTVTAESNFSWARVVEHLDFGPLWRSGGIIE